MRPGHAGCVRGRWPPGCSSPLGISMGSYWAYYELGWGGWWFWDPVENASFMPWLVGTALLHSAS
jgi:cytochrome c-type biogenesis protein CcmF